MSPTRRHEADRAQRRRGHDALRRFVSSNRDLESDALRKQAVDAGAETIGDSALRTTVELLGRLTVVTLNPQGEENRWLQAELSDGTGTVQLVWMGRRSIAGVEVGRTLRVWGRMGLIRGQRVIYNPRYELLT